MEVTGPKGKVDALLPTGIRLEQKDGFLHAVRDNDSQKAVHGLARALVFNAVEGVTNGWKKELDIVGIGYRAEMKGKGEVIFTLGYSHPIEFPLPSGISVTIDPKQTHLTIEVTFRDCNSLFVLRCSFDATPQIEQRENEQRFN